MSIKAELPSDLARGQREGPGFAQADIGGLPGLWVGLDGRTWIYLNPLCQQEAIGTFCRTQLPPGCLPEGGWDHPLISQSSNSWLKIQLFCGLPSSACQCTNTPGLSSTKSSVWERAARENKTLWGRSTCGQWEKNKNTPSLADTFTILQKPLLPQGFSLPTWEILRSIIPVPGRAK